MARKNGYATDDLIQNPAGVIESNIRDWILTQFGLTLTKTGSDYFLTGLNFQVDDYYNDAIFVDVTKNGRYVISDYVGSTQQITLTGSPSLDNNDFGYVKNIGGNAKFDLNSFDAIMAKTDAGRSGTASSTSTGKLVCTGKSFLTYVCKDMVVHNTTDDTYSIVRSVDSDTQLTLEDDIMASGEDFDIYGSRNGWLFDRSLTEQDSSMNILDKLCYESHCILFNSYDKYRLVTLDGGATDGTLSNPMVIDGEVQIFVEPTPLEKIYTDFTLNYDYDYAKKTYRKKLFVNRNSNSGTSKLDASMALCETAENTYKVSKKWEYSSDWIHDDFTAEEFLLRKIASLTYQRLKITYTGELSEHIQYERGDKVLLNYDLMMPTGKNNSQQFIIIGDDIDVKKKVMSLTLLY